MASSFSLEVIDPCNRTGKIVVPIHLVCETRGVVDFQQDPAKRQGKDLSLCLLFQKGRCNAGVRCHQVHVAPDFVESLRVKAASGSNCCADHGDMHSSGFAGDATAVRITGDGPDRCYPLGAFARTACLETFLRGSRFGFETRVPAAKICRLHVQGRCKFGRDCKNVHLCREARPSTAAAAAPPALTTVPPPHAKLASLPPAPVEFSGAGPLALDYSFGMTASSRSSSHRTDSPPATPKPASVGAPLTPPARAAPPCLPLFEQPLLAVAPAASEKSPQYDLSGFEATLRSMLDDIMKVECSPVVRTPARLSC